MTSPSSYLFYDSRNPLQERTEHTKLNRVVIKDKKVTIFSKQIYKTSKSGVLFEKILYQTTFSLHENKRGIKYLKRFTKSLGGGITDTSLAPLVTGKLFEERPISEECWVLVQKTILSWFGSDYSNRNIEDVKLQLLFPALRLMIFPPSTTLSGTLSQMQADYGIVTKALRENESWLAFLMDLCSPTAKRLEDIHSVHNHPEELLPIAIMNLGVTLSSLFSTEKDTLLKIRQSFMSLDLKFIHFMFKHIPVSSRGQALETLLSLVGAHSSRKSLRNSVSQFMYVDADVSLNRIPVKLRPKLAQEFLKSLQETYAEITDSQRVNHVQITTELSNVFRYWFAQLVLEPSVKTQLTVQDVESHFHELFGTSLRNGPSPIKFVKKNNVVFCILSQSAIGGKNEQYSSDIFTSLKALATNLPTEKGTGAGYHWLNGYVAADGAFVMSSGEFYSLDDITEMIDKGVVIVDEWLVKLDRKVTPENRRSFLTFGHKERKFKNTWQFYDWGVTDPFKILALKRSKIFKKEDVRTYSALPDEMFYEFLSLEAGKELAAESRRRAIVIDELWTIQSGSSSRKMIEQLARMGRSSRPWRT